MIILPAWYRALRVVGMHEEAMPRDVATRWNSTYRMLDYSVKHRAAIAEVTQDLKNGLCKYELTADEWIIVEQLQDVLKVSSTDRLCQHIELIQRHLWANNLLSSLRYSMTQHSFSPALLPTLRRLFLPWTSLINVC